MDLIERQAAIDALGEPPDSGDWMDEWECGCRSQWEWDKEALENVPSTQPTLCGYNIEHLVLIAQVLQKENLPPDRITEVLTDIGRIVAVVCDEFEETLKRSVEQGGTGWLN